MSAAPVSMWAAHRRRPWSPARELLTWPGAPPTTAFAAGLSALTWRKFTGASRQLWTTFAQGMQRRLEDAENVELIFGEAHFTGPKVVEVRLTAGGTRTLTADTIFINTGARPARPRIAGLDSVRALDSTSIMELQELPEHLLVLGGGYVGLEFGQMFRRFGSAVTVVQHGKQLLGREDPDVAAEVYKLLETDGIEILLETEAVGVHASASGVGLDLRGPRESGPSPAPISCSPLAECRIASSSTSPPPA